jgi:hypothetical protein
VGTMGALNSSDDRVEIQGFGNHCRPYQHALAFLYFGFDLSNG